MFQKKFDKLLLLLLLLLLATSVQCRPSADAKGEEAQLPVDPSEYPGNLSRETILKVQQCERDQTIMELCMRCAKITKVENIYPLCCNNDDDIKDWCQSYVFFNIENK